MPVGSALVLSRSWPAAGPATRISVSSVIRRAYWLSGTTLQAPFSFLTSMTEPLCAIISMRDLLGRLFREARFRDRACDVGLLGRSRGRLLDGCFVHAGFQRGLPRRPGGRLAGRLGRLELGPAGEHQLLRGVLVIDVQQAVLGAVGASGQREVRQVVAVVAELLGLGLGGLAHHVERGRAGQHRIAPADQDVGAVARRDRVVLGDHLLERLEAERGGAAPGGERESAGERPPSAPTAAVVTKPFSAVRRLIRVSRQLEQRPVGRAIGADVVVILDHDGFVGLVQTVSCCLPPQGGRLPGIGCGVFMVSRW